MKIKSSVRLDDSKDILSPSPSLNFCSLFMRSDSGVIFLKMTEKEFNNFFCAVGKTMMKALPVVTLEGIRYDEHSIVGRVGVRYISGMAPEGVSVTSEIIQLAMLFNGSAKEFKVDQFGREARIELTLDYVIN